MRKKTLIVCVFFGHISVLFNYERDLWLVIVTEDLFDLSVQEGDGDCVNSPFLLPDCVKMNKNVRDCVKLTCVRDA